MKIMYAEFPQPEPIIIECLKAAMPGVRVSVERSAKPVGEFEITVQNLGWSEVSRLREYAVKVGLYFNQKVTYARNSEVIELIQREVYRLQAVTNSVAAVEPGAEVKLKDPQGLHLNSITFEILLQPTGQSQLN